MAARSTLTEIGARLRAETESNPRLAALLLLVPLVLVVHLGLVVRDATAELRAERVPLERRAARLEALAESEDWAARIREQEARITRWEQYIWQASSAELAAADLQTALRGIITEHLAWNRLKLAPAEELTDLGGWRITAEITGKLRETGVLPLLQDLAEFRPRMLLDHLQVASQRGQTVSLRVSVVVLPERGE